MKLWGIFRFEVAYHLRRAGTWGYFVALVGLASSIALVFVGNARKDNCYFTAPVIIAAVAVMTSLFGVLVAAALAGDAATRDLHTRLAPLHYTVPISKAEYLGGRFLGAWAVYALMLLVAVPLAFALVLHVAGVEPELVGPFRPAAYLSAYALFALPNAFVATALLFTGAVLSRRALVSYVGAALLFMVSNVAKELVAVEAGRWTLATHLDPVNFTGISALWRSLSVLQKNTALIALEGPMLTGRLLWLGIAGGALVLAYWRFRFAHHVAGGSAERQASAVDLREAGGVALPVREIDAPLALQWKFATVVPQTGSTLAMRVAQLLAIARRSFGEIIKSRAAWALPLLAVLLVVAGPQLLEEELGTPSLPTTGRLTALAGHPLIGILVAALTTLFAGQLVWQERDAGLSDLTDVAPIPDWVVYLGKLMGLMGLLVAVQAMVLAAGLFIQLSLGYQHVELGVYLRILFGLQLTSYLQFAVVAMAGQVLLDKYVGYLAVFLVYLYTAYAGTLGVEHHLLVYGATPGWQYTDMGGFGGVAAALLWFKLYWTGWALLIGLLLMLFWVRGRETGVGLRIRLAQARFTRWPAVVAATGASMVLVSGGFIFYNTNVLNSYQPDAAWMARRAAYERRFGQFRDVPQPLLTGIRLHVELYPKQGQAQVQGTYRLINQHQVAIDSIHVVSQANAQIKGLRCDRPARLIFTDQALGYYILRLAQPLQPGDTLRLHFDQHFGALGFANSRSGPAVVPNGTWLENDWLPAVSYQPSLELANAGERRRLHLPARAAAPSLHDVAARLDQRGRERIDFETTIGTAKDQTAVAPGTLRRTWMASGRRYFHYVSAAPIRNIYALFSARYLSKVAKWQNVPIRVYYHPGHTQNLGRLVRSAQASLASYTQLFGPYPYNQLTLVETPGVNSSMRLTAYPGTIMYTEGFALVNPQEEQGHLDLPFAVLAHEMAHQWWGHQLVPANVEGAPVLSESLAWYSAMMVVEETYGREHLGRLLRMMRREYLTPRASAAVPLLRATDHFDVYRKGPFAMYALREYIGKQAVNTALRRLFLVYGGRKAPLPVSLDLYRELKAVSPDSLSYLLKDLFARNAFWELAATSARTEPAGAGRWRISFTIKARKTTVDSLGTETVAPLNDWVEIGFYAAGKGEEPGKELYRHQHRIRAGTQTITLTLPERPAWAGIDPRRLLIDRNVDDNFAEVEEGARVLR